MPSQPPTTPSTDQGLSNADQVASAADQVSADRDQRSSDRDQATADREHDASPALTSAEEREYDAEREEREAASDERLENQLERASTAHDRGVTGRLRDALAAGPNGVVAVDSQGSIIYASIRLEEMFGYDSGTLIGEQIECLIPDEATGRHSVHRESFARQAIPHSVDGGLDLMGCRRDGSEFPVEVSLSPIDTADGLQVFATVIDITARKASESRQLHAAKLESIGRLAAGIAHDFNNMLSVVQGYATLLTDDLAPERAAALDRASSLESLDAIKLAAARASDLCTKLLAFSRHQVVVPVVVDLNESVGAIEPLIRHLVGTDIQLDLRLHSGAGHIRVDPGWIDQLVVNLVVNARDAMPEGGTVVIETGSEDVVRPEVITAAEVEPGPYVFVSVRDTGVGIAADTREHIFEPYFTTKPAGQGTGLGLATTYGIVTQAGGHIMVDSAPGRGACFKLLFPLVSVAS